MPFPFASTPSQTTSPTAYSFLGSKVPLMESVATITEVPSGEMKLPARNGEELNFSRLAGSFGIVVAVAVACESTELISAAVKEIF